MDELSSSTVASRRLWSKAQLKKKAGGLSNRRELTVTLPVLARRPSGQHAGTSSHKTPLHAFLASQLDGNDRESYSRSQLRAMASSKMLLGSNNNLASTSSRIHSSAERLAPLDSANFEKTRAQQRRSLPRPLQAAIDETLAARSTDELLSDQDDSSGDNNNNCDVPETTTLPKVKRSSTCKTQSQSHRPEWRRYIRRIMMTKGIRGSTLARYRRLVGNVARKNLAQSYAEAAEHVVRYRLEFRSAVLIQSMALEFLTRRRRMKELRRHRAATTIQGVWRRVIEIKKQRKLVEIVRQAKIERLARLGAVRAIQRAYRKYRFTCRQHEEELRQHQRASMLQRARLKLLQKYQSWRQNSASNKLNRQVEQASSITPSETLSHEEFSSPREPNKSSPQVVSDHVEVIAPCTSIVRDELASVETPADEPQDILYRTEKTSTPIDQMLLTKALDDPELTQLEDYDTTSQLDQCTDKLDDVTAASSLDGNQLAAQSELPVDSPARDNQDKLLTFPLPPREFDETTTETITPSCRAESEPEDDNEMCDNSSDTHEAKTPTEFSDRSDLQRSPDDYVDVVDKTAAAKMIVRYLQPRIQAIHMKRSHAAIRIQCLARSYLAKQCMVLVRLEALRSLREQLYASWHRSDRAYHSPRADKQSELNVLEPEHDDEEDDFDLELQGDQTPHHNVSDNYLHLLPTRNGQIPPGVPLLQSSAGAPLLSLWKWSWPGEQWLSNGQ